MASKKRGKRAKGRAKATRRQKGRRTTKPRENDDEVLSGEILRAVTQLRSCLAIDEVNFVRVASVAHGDARAFVLYSALDDVAKAMIQRMAGRDMLQGDAVRPLEGLFSRLIVTQFVEPLQMRIRRLVELLVHLVHWSTTNDQRYYRFYTVHYRLERLLRHQRDFKEFFDATNENVAFQIRQHQSELEEMLSENSMLADAWFKRGRTFKDLLKSAIPMMRGNERAIVGQSYGDIYGGASSVIHYGIDDYRHHDGTMARPELLLTMLDTLAASAIGRIYDLAGEPDAPFAANVARAIRALPAVDETLADFRGTAEVGDIAVILGGLGQVREVRETVYGTRSLGVKFLADAPLPEVELDWFRASHVKPLFSFAHGEAKILEILHQFGREDTAVSQDAWAESAVAAWEAGLRDQVRGAPRRR